MLRRARADYAGIGGSTPKRRRPDRCNQGSTELGDPEPYLTPVAEPFRALAEAFVPEVSEMGRDEYRRLVEIVEDALDDRAPGIRRQLLLFVRILDWLPVFRHGRRLRSLDRERRARLLRRLQDSPLLAIRRGVWGLRSLVFMGYYGREEAREEIGYRARPGGWEARDGGAGVNA